jgi:enoyl-CoA hydratase/carnithine racemase
MGDLVRLDTAEGVATITLDSQHNRNALSKQLVGELGDALAGSTASSVRAIVLRHEGPAFCAGADLKERSDDGGAPDSRPFVTILERLMDSPVPTIAAVRGAVRAGGIGLMASCDLVVVHESVNFALTEVRIGVAPAIISVPILRRVPAGKIAAAMLTGEPFDAHEARSIGLVTHVTEQVDTTVAALCDGIRAGAPGAVAETKRILDWVPTLDRSTGFAEMSALSEAMFSGPDAAEGMLAFRQKRPPVWPTPPNA